MRKIALILILSIMLVSIVPVMASHGNEKMRVIVGFKGSSDAALIQAQDGDINDQYTSIQAIACNLPQQAIDGLKNNPKIAFVEPDAIMTTQDYTVDPELYYSWGVERVGAGIVQADGNNGDGVKVAVIDTGINYNHADLSANIARDSNNAVIGYNFVSNNNDPMDDNGHGSHCAGIIAALDNNQAVVGMAPKAILYPVKVLDSTGSGYVSTIAAGIDWAITQHVQVISMSLGGPTGSSLLQQECDKALSNNIVVVAAAGNSGQARYGSDVGYPAKYSSVIAVAATDSNNVRASFSSTGPEVAISAPGVNIISTYLGQDTLYMSGTSMACPHVAGAAALILETNPALTATQVKNILVTSADDLGSTGKDNLYGNGLLDVDRALNLATQTATNPATSFTMAKGTATGTISAAQTSDNTYLKLTSARVSGTTQTVDASFKVTVPQKQSQVASITIDCKEKSSPATSQTIYLYDYTTKTWAQATTQTVGTSDQIATLTGTNAARYVSSNGDISARIYSTSTKQFTCSIDALTFDIAYSS